MSQSNNSPMDLINQYFKKLVDRIHNLEIENSNLKTSFNSSKYKDSEFEKLKGEYDKLQADFSSLSERHKELKTAYTESENQVKELISEKELILRKEKDLSDEIKNTFEQMTKKVGVPFFDFPHQQQERNNFQTPIKEINKQVQSNASEESQKSKHQKSKTNHPMRNLVLKNLYESDSDDSDDSDDSCECPVANRSIKKQFHVPPIKVSFNDLMEKACQENSNCDNKKGPQVVNTSTKETKEEDYEQSLEDAGIEILKKLIGNDLWNHIEASVNQDQASTPQKQANLPNKTQHQHQNQNHQSQAQAQPVNSQFNRDPGHGRNKSRVPLTCQTNQQYQNPNQHFQIPSNTENIFSNDKPSEEELAFFTNLMGALLRSPMGGGKK